MPRLLLTSLDSLASACFRDRENRSGYNYRLMTTEDARFGSKCLGAELLEMVFET
jgi:hypothetical protein